ncbi:MAG: hypothetical protein RMJ31_07665 [Nitrososphaerota archaeon]|nr:hypothetical protein [Nitrososphaerales archaeon]MDW8045624.1 hypothetical protein [Nitrososphaerota archaeon]
MKYRLLPIMGIITVAWFLIFLGSFIIFKIVAPIPEFLPGYFGVLITAIVKVILATFLVICWILIMVWLRDLYVKRKLLKKAHS